jgi:hypothetical protein
VPSILDSPQKAFAEYFRCPPSLVSLSSSADLSVTQGYFSVNGEHCFGRAAGLTPSRHVASAPAAHSNGHGSSSGGLLPFDLAEVVTNLRHERYRDARQVAAMRLVMKAAAERAYYLVRPMLPVGVRKHLQQARLRGWEQIQFPRWPVDTTVDVLMEHSMAALLKAAHLTRLPFVWFWPDGSPTCTMVTHDVEGRTGLDFVPSLIELDDQFGIKASYQLIPEGSECLASYAPAIRELGCEVNLHDLNHDGQLYRDKDVFLQRAQRINQYAREYECEGFRSGAMYREQSWYGAFEFKYDMSVPSVAHLEPQRGGCCTVMPYFIDDILELPLTTAQDYSMFFILGDYSTALWREQIAAIRARHGLVSVIAHPDYLVGARERRVYTELLEHLASLRDAGETWVALPGEVNRWWRARQQMTLTPEGASWRISGPDSDRARLAYASLDGDRIVYSLEQAA